VSSNIFLIFWANLALRWTTIAVLGVALIVLVVVLINKKKKKA
jgi:drug/metabolite transporter (DMT)-like permease